MVSRAGTSPNEYLYRGERFETAIAAYYLRARYYSPGRGRFVTRDVEEGTLQSPISQHPYLYADADPVNRLDPSGHSSIMGFGFIGQVAIPQAVMGGTTAAVAGTCGLSPAASALVSLNSSNPGPVVSACAGGAILRYYDLPIPGDCPQALYDTLNAWAGRACDGRIRRCRQGIDTKSSCAAKMAVIEGCILARSVREMACFRGGNAGHAQTMGDLLRSFGNCRAVLSNPRTRP